MTPQEIFNTAWEKVTAQGKKCVTTYGTCLYHNPRTANKCAAGHLMNPAELAFAKDYVGSINALLMKPGSEEVFRPFWEENKELILHIQQAHDVGAVDKGPDFVETFQENMRMLAKKFKLEVPE